MKVGDKVAPLRKSIRFEELAGTVVQVADDGESVLIVNEWGYHIHGLTKDLVVVPRRHDPYAHVETR